MSNANRSTWIHGLPLVAALCCLAACRPASSPEAGMAPPASTPPAVGPPSPPASTAVPAFDCTRAESEAEKLVCADPALSALDQRLAEVFEQAKSAPGVDVAQLVTLQRGWVKGRDDCWKADDQVRCVREAYLTQITDLQINHGGIVVPSPVEFACGDNSKPFTMVFYNQLDPQAAVLTWGNDQAIVFPVPAASGARYGREGVDFWEHQGEATVEFYGTRMTCRAAK
jgi:uncharacterized protein